MTWVLEPHSAQSRAVAHLWWWMLAVGGTIWLGVTIVMLVVIARRRTQARDGRVVYDTTASPRTERIVASATFGTVLILTGFLAFDFVVGRTLAAHPQRALKIALTAHQWWWEAEYVNPDPSRSFVTANEIHIPVGERVQLELRASDVIHSVWIPDLQGKRDLIPGYTSTLWIEADAPRVYQGRCAEFCGLQHANMSILVIAEPRDAFARWAAAQASAAATPPDAAAQRGKRAFENGPCATCHAIGGTSAYATVGPNLTHFASRRTVGAGVLPNTRGALEAWLISAPSLKPGVRMPTMTMYSGAQLRDIAAYLASLK